MADRCASLDLAACQGSILITGANRPRGIGFALVKHLLGLPVAPKHVFATCRSLKAENAQELRELAEKNPTLHLMELDVTQTSQLPEIAEKVSNVVGEFGLNVLINNAGVYYPQSLQDVTVQSMMKSYEANTVGPLMITKQFLPLLRKAALQKMTDFPAQPLAIIVNISSLTASIDDNGIGGLYPSRASKVALNMVTRSLSIDLAQDGIIAVCINPGWVKTDLGGEGGKITSSESATSLIKVIVSLDKSSSGCFFNYDGKVLPW